MGFGHCVLEKFPITSISNAEDFRVLQKALQETLTTDTDIPSVVIINWKFLNDRE